MRKKIIFILSIIIMLFAALNTYGAEGVIKDGRTFVPVRGVFESLGFNVSWDSVTSKASISDGTHSVSVIKGMNYFKADGRQIYPDVPQQVINGSLYLPLRAVGDSIGANISWDGNNKTAHISYNGRDAYIKCKEITTNQTAAASSNSKSNAAVKSTPSTAGTTYILNTNTKKFHYPSCSSASEIKDKNKRTYNGSRDDVIKMGYAPCKRCNP